MKKQPTLITLVTILLVAISATCQVWGQSDSTLQNKSVSVSVIDGKTLARLNSLPAYIIYRCIDSGGEPCIAFKENRRADFVYDSAK